VMPRLRAHLNEDGTLRRPVHSPRRATHAGAEPYRTCIDQYTLKCNIRRQLFGFTVTFWLVLSELLMVHVLLA
jgi:hypothetical protein